VEGTVREVVLCSEEVIMKSTRFSRNSSRSQLFPEHGLIWLVMMAWSKEGIFLYDVLGSL